MGFFVILLAFNMGPKGNASGSATTEPGPAAAMPFDMSDVAIAIRDAFNNPVDIASSNPAEANLVQRLVEQRARGETQDKGPLGNRLKVQSIRPGEYYSVCGTVMFASGSTTLDEEGRKALEDVANYVRGVQLVVDVRGHVSAAEALENDDHGVRLSFERAMTVGAELVKLGATWPQLRLQASGDSERIVAPVYDWEGHKKNQRVEITISDAPVRNSSTEPVGP